MLEQFAANDPTLLARLLRLWERAPALPGKVRMPYRVVWRDDDEGILRFLGQVTTASHPDALSFNDWIPADADTFARLERIVRRLENPAR